MGCRSESRFLHWVEVLGLWMAGLRENSSIGWRNRGSDEALVGNSSSGWRFLDGCIAFSVRFVPMTGGFWPLMGPSAGGSFHLLEESGLQQSVQREDSSSGWMNRDDERLVWARIVPVSGGFGTVDGGFGTVDGLLAGRILQCLEGFAR